MISTGSRSVFDCESNQINLSVFVYPITQRINSLSMSKCAFIPSLRYRWRVCRKKHPFFLNQRDWLTLCAFSGLIQARGHVWYSVRAVWSAFGTPLHRVLLIWEVGHTAYTTLIRLLLLLTWMRKCLDHQKDDWLLQIWPILMSLYNLCSVYVMTVYFTNMTLFASLLRFHSPFIL